MTNHFAKRTVHESESILLTKTSTYDGVRASWKDMLYPIPRGFIYHGPTPYKSFMYWLRSKPPEGTTNLEKAKEETGTSH